MNITITITIEGPTPRARCEAAKERLPVVASDVNDPVAVVVADLVRERGHWKGSAGELLRELNRLRGEPAPPAWPAAPTTLGIRLNRLVPLLEARGIVARRGKCDDHRFWTIALATGADGAAAGATQVAATDGRARKTTVTTRSAFPL